MIARSSHFLTCFASLSRPARLLAVALAFAAPQALAQGPALRDPTLPPPGYGAPAVIAREPIESFRPEHLVTVDGQHYVMWRGSRYRAGDTVQGARIERIEESGVWIRTAEGSRKLPLYAGIEKRTR